MNVILCEHHWSVLVVIYALWIELLLATEAASVIGQQSVCSHLFCCYKEYTTNDCFSRISHR
jgi:hypothetical protein